MRKAVVKSADPCQLVIEYLKEAPSFVLLYKQLDKVHPDRRGEEPAIGYEYGIDGSIR